LNDERDKGQGINLLGNGAVLVTGGCSPRAFTKYTVEIVQ